ncbi:MAG: MFS transporter [Smithella sp.]|jgi:MFS family permease|nr:MFS transporter [Syntrophaceae bacterium]MBP8665706.1 MFS transporter [Syntrophaceae bacterium]MBP9530977.1 MFS transporter [Syntrophaceae bacterium]MBP9650203.1 MFS transporter [Syntrophaceae bacterium]NMC90765.1 MFS transporter [Smithella sp.]
MKMRKLPAGIWALGFVSFFMDISSELIHSLLPIFMLTTLGASMIAIGIIEGIAEAAASIAKVFSGIISDYIRKRKILAVLGYGLAAITKPLFPLATTIGWVFSARFIDRIGKGIRGAPRDALVADITPSHQRGAAYGLRQALDSAGAFMGPLAAVVLMIFFVNDIRKVLWIAVIPAFIALGVLILGVHEPERQKTPNPTENRFFSFHGARRLPSRYWLILGLNAIFTLARFSEAFLILRAQSVGLAVGFVPAIMIVMNAVYALTAYPAGILTDRMRPRIILAAGLAVLIAADTLLAFAETPFPVFIGAALWGLHMGLTQGLFAKLVADHAPVRLRGTAFGIFNLVTGGALLTASVVAGLLWSAVGAQATFMAGAAFTALALLGVIVFKSRTPSTPHPGQAP